MSLASGSSPSLPPNSHMRSQELLWDEGFPRPCAGSPNRGGVEKEVGGLRKRGRLAETQMCWVPREGVVWVGEMWPALGMCPCVKEYLKELQVREKEGPLRPGYEVGVLGGF